MVDRWRSSGDGRRDFARVVCVAVFALMALVGLTQSVGWVEARAAGTREEFFVVTCSAFRAPRCSGNPAGTGGAVRTIIGGNFLRSYDEVDVRVMDVAPHWVYLDRPLGLVIPLGVGLLGVGVVLLAWSDPWTRPRRS